MFVLAAGASEFMFFLFPIIFFTLLCVSIN